MRIGIIGGGAAGLATAWLLQECHQVTLLEKENRLGGHAQTVEVEIDRTVVRVESGFEFFIEETYPCFAALLRALELPIHRYPLTFTLYASGGDAVHLLPPVRRGCVRWSALRPQSLSHMWQLVRVLRAASRLVEKRDWSVTLGDFVQRLGLSRTFRDDFLYPFLNGGWCVSLDQFRHFAAYDVLKYVLLHRVNGLTMPSLSEVPGGTQAYIAALKNALSRTLIETGVEIRCIRRCGEIYVLEDASGQHRQFDHVVLATNAISARGLLEGVSGAGPQREALDGIRYFQTSIAIHADRRLMPPREQDWSVFNVRWDSQRSLSTIWRRQMGGTPVFRSWIANGNLPDPLYHLATYWHPIADPSHFRAQELLGQLQGRESLWFAGAYTHDIDSHESAIRSAIRVAREFVPASANLQRLRHFAHP
jgi:predicted NAD/FAD-binding protein